MAHMVSAELLSQSTSPWNPFAICRKQLSRQEQLGDRLASGGLSGTARLRPSDVQSACIIPDSISRSIFLDSSLLGVVSLNPMKFL